MKEFKAALDANDAEFPMSLVETLWGIIQRLQVRSSCVTIPFCVQLPCRFPSVCITEHGRAGAAGW